MTESNRREFIQTSLAVGMAAGLGITGKVRGANDQVRVAIVGLGVKGPQHAKAFSQIEGVRVVALCDVDRNRLASHGKSYTQTLGDDDLHVDFRQILDRKDVDAVVLATPNNWHALQTIWSCESGKDVYVEKPMSHTVFEGRQMINAADRHKRIVQVGIQRRSDSGVIEAAKWIADGNLGQSKLAHVVLYRRRDGIGKVDGPQAIPQEVDYDLWTGPAAMKPLMRKNLHYDWHWDWNTGGGELANNGVHFIDVARNLLGDPDVPPRVISIGGRFGWHDDGQTPNTQLIYHDGGTVPILVEIRALPAEVGARSMDRYRDLNFGLLIECEGGYFSGFNGGWAYDQAGKRIQQFVGDGGGEHQANFISAVRSRRTSDLKAPLLQGHLATTMCNISNISWLTGRPAAPDAIRNAINTMPRLADAFERMVKHLTANDIDLDKYPITLGSTLNFQSDRDVFTGEPGNALNMANALLLRNGREPFVFPK